MSNIVIPMAGAGSRFSNAGYQHPKPFIPIKGIPMIEYVIKNIATPEDKIYLLANLDHVEYFKNTNLEDYNICIIPVLKRTEGAACTVLLAKAFINNEEPLTIVNSDQFVDFDQERWNADKANADALIMTFEANDPKWSFAKTDSEGRISEVAEKRVISNNATVGVYWFSKGCYFVDSAEEMISKNIRVNNEFYVSPVFNKIIEKDLLVKSFAVEKMYGLGTPEDFEENYGHITI